MAEIVIQAVGVGMEEALIVSWLKQPGDAVAVDDPVAEIETDKATMDVVSPFAGTLGPHLVGAGDIVAVGTAIVAVLDGSEMPAAAPAPDAREQEAGGSKAAAAPAAAGETAPADGAPAPHRLSPRARRLAAAAGGTRAAGETAAAAAAPAGDGRFRQLIATKVAESWREIPHFTVSREVNAAAMQKRLETLRAESVEPGPTLTDLLLVALARALDDGGEGGQVDVGLAVATVHGVVIPVVRDVLGQDPAQLARSRQGAVERARAGKLNKDDLSATPSSTLSNLGSFGVDRFTGIVATGQTSLLTVGRVLPRPVAGDDGEISVQMMFDATLNADHRVVDGAQAARLLVAFATAAETMASDH
jgi:pyruvate/2-oxoglutarate dehydrogenase complex dihydrolipoamide acyltransferase (E2) component